ncbi:MAG TPA: sigma-54 dependent transcriptional regulator [Candidatus Binatus sp.]|jgi:two-component system, NtrC family, response regulator HupR/HoxA|nr:sigma-54 dependent transcriptional regulator [Candidatus Binatus sp.]
MSEREAPRPALLVVDDEPQVLALIPQLFDGEFPVLTARSGAEALARLAEQEVGVVVADQRMPEMAGTELLARIAEERPDVVRILLTAYADIESLLGAINTGRVYQFVTKPWENRELAMVIRRAMETYRLRTENALLLAENVRLVGELRAANENLETENRVLRREVGERYKLGNLIGASPAMEQAFRLLEKAGQSQASVLIVGETGTGKELAAGCIHHTSPRRARKFVAVNCAAMPESLLESELFGHVKGAFTGALRDRHGVFEEASGGTIFLDEIGEMSPTMQAKVLRVVEDGIVRPVGASESVRVDVRLICATHRDLKAEVEAGRFRRDLLYRVNVFPIALPPLRARQGDVRLLVQHFFEKYNTATGKALRGFTPAALSALERYGWPGNVRELRNEVERAVALAEPGEAIDIAHLSADVSGDEALTAVAEGDGKLRERLDRIEQLLIVQELRRHGENRTRTARHLGISVRALQKKIGKYGLRQDGE